MPSDAAAPPASDSRSTLAALDLYVRGLGVLGSVVLIRAAIITAHTPEKSGWLLFAALAFLAGSFKLNFASISASISVADTFFITSAILFGPEPAALTIAIDSLVICVRRGDPWSRTAFNVAASGISLWVA